MAIEKELLDQLLAGPKIRPTAGIARGLRLNTASKPSSTSCLRAR